MELFFLARAMIQAAQDLKPTNERVYSEAGTPKLGTNDQVVMDMMNLADSFKLYEESKWPLYAPKTAKIGDKVQFIGYEGIYNLDEVQWIGQQGIIKLFTDDNVWVYFGDDGNHPGRDSLVKCSWESIAKVLKGGKNLELYEIPAEEKAKKEKSFRFPKAVVDDDEKKR